MSGGRLRRDLVSVHVDDSRRAMRIIVDEIAGRFTRVTTELWKSLHNGTATQDHWQQARHAGWTCERRTAARKRFSLLYIRIPLGSVDRVAAKLVAYSGWLFSSVAVSFWSVAILVAALLLIGRREQWIASLGSLSQFFAQTNPVVLGAWFVATKIAHELAHAVMCRRIGSRCGSVGVLILCGMPCPFCDVSDSVRHPSPWRRASVMMAGIYVELIIAAIATFVWIIARDPAVRLHAMNLMLVCGVSTIVFNANPLMRYDGYFILSDWIGSVNLRAESAAAFTNTITKRLVGIKQREKSGSARRSVFLSTYYASSSVYRIVVLIAIAAMLLAFADRVHLRPLMAIVVLLAATMMTLRFTRRLAGVARGKNIWASAPVFRRNVMVAVLFALIAATLFIPMPRYSSAIGRLDAVGSVKVFLPGDAIVEQVAVNFGDVVEPNEFLVRLGSEAAEIEASRIRGQLRVASLRSRLARRVTIKGGNTDSQWETFDAVERTLETQLTSVRKRADRYDIRSTVGGVVLPAEAVVRADPLRGVMPLTDRIGTLANSRQAWCRISPNGQIHAVLQIDSRDRNHVRIGTPVRICVESMHGIVFDSKIESVSAIDVDSESVVRRAAYEVTCPLAQVSEGEVLGLLGTNCSAAIRLPARTLAEDLFQSCKDGLGG